MTSRPLLMLAAALNLCGCAHILFYDQKRDEQAQAAVKAVAEAHLAATVESLDKAYAEVAAREEEAARGRAAQLFDFEVTEISGAASLTAGQERFDLQKIACPSPAAASGTAAPPAPQPPQPQSFNQETMKKLRQPLGLVHALTLRLQKLGLRDTSPDGLANYLVSQGSVAQEQQSLEQQFIGFYATHGVRLASCTEVDAIKIAFFDRWQDDKKTTANVKFRDIRDACINILKRRSDMFCSGEILAATANTEALQAEHAAIENQRSDAQSALKHLTPDLEDPSKNADGTPALETTETRAKELRELLTNTLKGGKLGGLEVLSEEQGKRLESLLGAIAGTPADDAVPLSKNQKITVTMLREFASFKDDADKLLKEAGRPRLVPVLAAVEYQKQEVAKYKALIAVKEKEAVAARKSLEAAMSEATGIANALARINENSGWKSRSISDLNRNLPKNEKRIFFAALAAYGEDVRRSRIDAAVWKSRQLAAQYERVQVTSKYAAIQWDALMDLAAKVLADYHAAGIKPDDLNEFFKALGLVTIGVGAAQ